MPNITGFDNDNISFNEYAHVASFGTVTLLSTYARQTISLVGGNLTIDIDNDSNGQDVILQITVDGSTRALGVTGNITAPSAPYTLTASKVYLVILNRFSTTWYVHSVTQVTP